MSILSFAGSAHAQTGLQSFMTGLSPSSMNVGGVANVEVTLGNGTVSAITNVRDTIHLPAGVVLAASPTASTTCSGGTITSAVAGSGTVAMSGGSMASGGVCSIRFKITSSTPAVYELTPGTPSGSAGTGSEANSFTFTVNAVEPVLDLSLIHSGTPTQGGLFALEPTLTNTGNLATSGTITLTSTLPTGLSYSSAGASSSSWDCAGSSGVNISCTFTGIISAHANAGLFRLVIAVAPDAGTPLSVTISASGGGASNTATASDTIPIAQTSPTISSVVPGLGLARAGTMPASVTITGTNFDLTPANNAVSFGGSPGTVTGGSATSLTVTPPARATGAIGNVTVTSGPGQSATLTNGYRWVEPPKVTAAFGTASIASGGSTTLTLTISNPNPVMLGGITIAAQALPSGLTGTLTGGTCSTGAVSGNAVRLNTTNLSANGSCTVIVTVTSTTPNTYSYTTGAIAALGADTTPFPLPGDAATTPAGLTVANSANADLSNLVLSQGTLNPGFGAGTTNYTASVAANVTSLNVTPTLADPGASIRIDGISATSGSPRVAALVPGPNMITVRVTAQDTTTTKDYVVTVTRAIPVPTLTSLSFRAANAAGGNSSGAASTITLTGQDFTNANAVHFGSATLASGAFTIVNDTTITLTVPTAVAAGVSGVGGVVDVSVASSTGTSSAQGFTYVLTPTINALATPSNNNTLVFTGTAMPGARIVLDITGPTPLLTNTIIADGGGAWSYTLPGAQDGSYTAHIHQSIGGANSSETNDIAFVIDTVGPAAPIVTAPIENAATGASVTLAGTTDAGTTVEVQLDSGPFLAATVSGTSWSFNLTGLAIGARTATARARDALGNLSATNSVRHFIVGAAPTIGAPSPASGPVAGGTAVTLTGAGLTGATLTVDGAAATPSAITATSLSFTTPPHAAGAVNVVVTTGGGSATTSFTYVAPPTAGNVTGITVGFNTAKPIDLSGAITGSHTSLTISTVPAHGTTSIAGDVVTYTPATSYVGADSFAYTATGLGGTSAPATVNLTVSQGAQTITFNALADVSLSASPLTLSATASSGLAVSFTSTTTTTCTVSGTTLTLLQTGTCSIDANQAGNTSFIAAPTATRAFTVTSANLVIATNAPSGTIVGVHYSQANPASGGTAPYHYAIATGPLPAGTTLDTTTGTVSGTPTTAGAFSYAIQATDSQGSPVTATGTNVAGTIAKGAQTISFTSTAPASAVVGGASYSVAATASSGLPVTISLDGTSAGCALAGSTVTFTGGGSCRINANQAGDADWNAAPQGQQSFTVNAASAIGLTLGFSTATLAAEQQGTLTLTFANVNASASASFDTALHSNAVILERGASLGGTCTGFATTSSASQLNVTGLSIPAGGCTIIASYKGLSAGTATVTADGFTPAGYPSTPGASSGTVTVVPSVTALSPASGPAREAITITGTGFSATLGDNIVHFGGAVGTVTAASATALTVTAPATGSGSVIVTVTVNGQTSTGSVTYTFIDKPVVADKPGVAVSYASTGTAIDLTGSITGGSHASISIGTAPAHGTVTIAGDVVTYTPAATYFGADSFTYTATGAGGTSNVATVSLTVATPAAPVATDKSGVAVPYASTGTAIDLADSVTGVHTTIAVATAPTHGAVTIAGNVATYVPATGYFGADSFTWTATGPGGTSASATVSLDVATPPPPVAAPGAGSVEGRTTTAGTSVDIDLSALVTGIYDTIRIQTQPGHGVVVLHGGTAPRALKGDAAPASPVIATYTPAVNFAGTDSFTYVAVGPGGTSAPGTVTVSVVGQVPEAPAKAASTGDGQSVSVMLTDGARGGPFTAANVVSVSPADAATTSIVASGSGSSAAYRLDVTPNSRFGGTIVVTYTLSNMFGTSAPSTVTLTVEARPDPRDDPNVGAISDAQAEAARRFARAQVSNFMRRNEQLHNGGGRTGMAMGLTLGSRDGMAAMQRPDDRNWGLAITERMRMSGEDPAIGRYANDPQSSLSRGDQLGSGRMFATDPHSPGMSGAGTPGAASARADDTGKDGTRRIGSVATWAGGSIDIGTRDVTTDRSKVTATTAGLSAGADIKLAENVLVGLGGGYGNDLSRIGTAAQVRGKSTLYAAYASIQPGGNAFIDGMIGRGQLDFSTRRIAAAVNSTAIGSRDGSYTTGAISVGIDRNSGALIWSLYGRGEYMGADLDAYAETGAGRYNLRFDSRQVESITGTIGGRIEYRQKTGFGSVTPRVRAEWNHEFADVDAQWLDYADIPGAALYALSRNGWKREQLQLSLGTRFDILRSGWSFDVETGLRAGQGEKAGTFQLRLSKEF